VGNEVKEGGRKDFGAKKGSEISMGKGRGWVFGSSTKQLEWLHLQLMHWWLLVHSSPIKGFPHNPI